MHERALLVGLELPNMPYDMAYYLEELANLCHSCFIECCEKVTQKLPKINPKYYIGSGKVEEIKLLIAEREIDIVIFDDELSPSQIRNLEEKLEIKVIDRSFLILQIFASRAQTHEAMLEVELAQLKYLLPRLSCKVVELTRQGGGSGSVSAKGPGEKKLELDRRLIVNEITKIEQKLSQVKKNRQTERSRRQKQDIPIVALVGYTNSGKSTTMNTIMEATRGNESKFVLSEDKLFATLGVHIRKIRLPNHQEFLLLDTVGFVSKLPHHFVQSFRSTLEEIQNAALVIHVVDVSSPYSSIQVGITDKVLRDIDVVDVPKLYLFNKTDKCTDYQIPAILDDALLFSNKNKQGLTNLLDYIANHTLDYYQKLTVFIPFNEGKCISFLDAYAVINAKIIKDDGVFYDCYVPTNSLSVVQDFIISP